MQKDHEDLLCQLVEAAKSVPEKQPFHCLGPFYGSTRGEVRHVGIPGLALSVYVGDVQDLAGLGLIAVRGHGGHNEFSFDVSPQGFATYSQLRAGSSERVEQIPDLMHAYVDSGVFRSRYAEAVEKWMAAEKALWATDSDTRTDRNRSLVSRGAAVLRQRAPRSSSRRGSGHGSRSYRRTRPVCAS